MPIVEFSDSDLLRGTVLTPGWYRVKVNEVGEAPAKASDKGPSTNYPVSGTVLFNGDTGDVGTAKNPIANVPLEWNFNSKAIGFASGFLKALGVEVASNTRFDLAAAEGLELDVYVENGEWQGRIVNRVNHKYRAPKADVSAAG